MRCFYTAIHKDLDDALAIFSTTPSPYTGATAKTLRGANFARGLKTEHMVIRRFC
jgi:hypothetical protein